MSPSSAPWPRWPWAPGLAGKVHCHPQSCGTPSPRAALRSAARLSLQSAILSPASQLFRVLPAWAPSGHIRETGRAGVPRVIAVLGPRGSGTQPHCPHLLTVAVSRARGGALPVSNCSRRQPRGSRYGASVDPNGPRYVRAVPWSKPASWHSSHKRGPNSIEPTRRHTTKYRPSPVQL